MEKKKKTKRYWGEGDWNPSPFGHTPNPYTKWSHHWGTMPIRDICYNQQYIYYITAFTNPIKTNDPGRVIRIRGIGKQAHSYCMHSATQDS